MARIEKLFLSLLTFLVPKCQLVGNNNYAEPFVMEFPYFHFEQYVTPCPQELQSQ